MRTDDLIRALAADSRTVEPPPRRSFWLALGLAVAATAAIFFALIGFRHDIAAALQTLRFPFKFVVTLGLAIPAAAVAMRLLRPDAPAGRRLWILAIGPALLALAVIVELVVMPPDTWMARMVGHNAGECMVLIPALSIIPLAGLLWAFRQGAPARPRLAGAVAGLLAGGLAATFYASNCFDDSPLFVALWYSLAIGLVTLAGAWLGGRLLRW